MTTEEKRMLICAAKELRKEIQLNKDFYTKLATINRYSLVNTSYLEIVLGAVPECQHPKTQFIQSTSGNESWYECVDCGASV